jgi:ketosteroid isomerase-like protein
MSKAFMEDSAQVAVVRRLYEARGNPDVIRQVLAPDVRWEVVDGFPHSGIYIGLDNVIGNFFRHLFQDFENFVASGSEFIESGDRVVALGAYTGRAKATGRDFTARFTHVWTLQGGRIIRLQQCADTVQVVRALGG